MLPYSWAWVPLKEWTKKARRIPLGFQFQVYNIYIYIYIYIYICCKLETWIPKVSYKLYIYIYIYIPSLRKTKIGHIRIMNLFPYCYGYWYESITPKENRTSSDTMDKLNDLIDQVEWICPDKIIPDWIIWTE